MSEWQEYKLGEVTTLHYGKALKSENRIEGNVPVYSSAGLTGYHNEALIDEKGLIIGRKGTVGKVYFSEKPFWCIDTAYYVLPNEKKYDFSYLYYLLQTLGLEHLNEDSAVPGLNRETAYNQSCFIPPLPEQKAIAAVLSSLDDKIDILHRQNKTLEAMAETLFRQLFIEEAREDWEEGRLGDVIELHYGKGLKTEERAGRGYPVVGSSGIVDHHTEFLVKGPGIVIGRKGTLGKVIYLWDNFYPIDTTYYVKSNVESAGLLYEYFLLKTIGFEDMNTDSAVPGLNRDIALSTEIRIPPEDKLHAFNELVADFVGKLKTNRDQILTLEQLRDTLLPKLMSGEIRVKIA
ncbi:MAG: restriction endonuclease subunit S [Gammaproteobacteria bacterium HGW-Gammaproteobacteria-10]|nr:MAG: restriction endonuclease subunit S [Gammaproteobacteria bacterium HGW-Gammaproteobacteria-10]